MSTALSTERQADPPASSQSYRLRTPNTKSSPRVCRETVAVLLAATGHPNLVDVAKILVSEVVTNVHQHTSSPVVHLEAIVSPEGVLVSVTDNDPDGRPGPRVPTPHEESGRGMLLLRALAHRWGVTWTGGIQPTGKRVWFELFETAVW
jgi:anti-sigma regulatory factor (Ser/Thr protein kinase)